jgi:hypothetical protein
MMSLIGVERLVEIWGRENRGTSVPKGKIRSKEQ